MSKLYPSFKLLIAAALLVFTGAVSQTAYADDPCPGADQCSDDYNPFSFIPYAYCGQGGQSCCDCNTTKNNLQRYMDIHRKGGEGQPSFLFKTYWEDTVNPGLQTLLNEVLETIVKQTATKGGFLTAQDNINSRSALQAGGAEAARNYAPSEALCRYGTLGQGLGSADIKRQATQIQIATQGLKRSLGSYGSIAQAGNGGDARMRMDAYVKEYCDPNLPGMKNMCGTAPQRFFPDVPKDQRFARDVNFAKTMDTDDTISVDFLTSKADPLPAEADVIALGDNLYGSHQMSSRLSEKAMSNSSSQNIMLQTRSVAATRAVAENTYASIAAMKSQGSGGPKTFMKNLLAELGMGKTTADSVLGNSPSYYAQMGVLTKKLYQDPAFYINLMEGNTNVARQSGAMEGIELMQDRDIYQSMQRSEMLLALMVQLESQGLLKDTAEDVKTRNNQ